MKFIDAQFVRIWIAIALICTMIGWISRLEFFAIATIVLLIDIADSLQKIVKRVENEQNH